MKTIKKLNTFNILLAMSIILWGAWVRLSGSGAGCGSHWPLCNGEVIPVVPSTKTLIEYFHRITSGLFGITVLLNCFFAWKNLGKKHLLFKVNLLVLFVTIIESLIGAVLVKKGLVEKNSSNIRALVIAIHLVNTYFLLATMVWVQELCNTGREKISQYSIPLYSYLVMLLFLAVGSSGAVTALGNTLFPDTSLIEGMAKDFDSNSPFLIQLRFIHPLLAGFLCLCLYQWNAKYNSSANLINSFNLSRSFFYQITLMIIFGILNWILLSPTWGALTHLFLGDALWMSFIYLNLAKK